MGLLYFLFEEKNKMPGEYFAMPEGEKQMIRAFFLKTMERRRE